MTLLGGQFRAAVMCSAWLIIGLALVIGAQYITGLWHDSMLILSGLCGGLVCYWFNVLAVEYGDRRKINGR